MKLLPRLVAGVLILLLSPMAANATLLNYSYDTGGGVLSFDLEGIILPDNDTIEVSSILGPVRVDGVEAFELPQVGTLLAYFNSGDAFAGVSTGIMSFSGATMDILACSSPDCFAGFYISSHYELGSPPSDMDIIAFASGDLGLPDIEIYDAANQRIVTTVAEPGTVALLSIGLGGLGLLRRRRVVAGRV